MTAAVGAPRFCGRERAPDGGVGGISINCGQGFPTAGRYAALSIDSLSGCALEDGSGALVCWGNGFAAIDGYRGSTTLDAGPFVDVVAGRNTACAREASGRVRCFGFWLWEPRSDDFVALAGYGGELCGLRSDGRLECSSITPPRAERDGRITLARTRALALCSASLPMHAYLDLLRTILDHGRDRQDRTGVGTRGVFGHQMRFDLRQGFPLLTTKKIHMRSIAVELLWFLRGDTRVDWLREHGVTIWDEWATPEQCAKFGRQAGDLGPVYGHQWRNFGATRRADGSYEHDGFDQITALLEQIRKNPNSRRLLVTGWNPREAEAVELPPCHTLFQLYVQDGELSCQLYQRSADVFLGVPFNIASYALLTHMIAQVCGLAVGDFVHTLGDAHLYSNHLEQARLQLTREPRLPPKLTLNPEVRDLFAFRYGDIRVEGYDPHPHIKAEVAV